MKLAMQCAFDDLSLARVEKGGIKALQLRLGPGFPIETRDTSLDEARAAADALAERGFTVETLGFYRNILDPEEAVRQDEEKRLRNVVRMAREVFKVKVIGVFAGRQPNLSIEENIPLFREVWTPIVRFAEDYNVRFAFENCSMFRGYPVKGINMAHTPHAYSLMFDAVSSPILGIEFDPSHCLKQLIDPIKFMREFTGRIYHFHAKDHERLAEEQQLHGCFDVRCSRDRLPGHGQIDFAALVEALKIQGYDGPVTIEGHRDPVYTEEKEYAEALVKSRKMLEELIR